MVEKTVKDRAAFGERLMRLREERGLSQSDIARQLEVSSTGVWNWEQGNTIPRPATLVRLASLLGVAPDFLRDGTIGDAQGVTELTPFVRSSGSLTEMIRAAREEIARAAGVSLSAVKVVIDFAEQ